MARKRNSKRKKETRNIIVLLFGKIFGKKVFLIILLCHVLGAGVFLGARQFFLNSHIFTIEKVIVNISADYPFQKDKEKLKFRYLGRNIFSVDLKHAKTLAQSDFPQFKKIEIRKKMPDIIEFSVIPRTPFAVIDSGGGMVVDSDGIVLAVEEEVKNLVKIRGIKFFLHKPSKGEKIKNKTLDKALLLIGELYRAIEKSENTMRYIDVSRRNNVELNVSGVLIKMGKDNFSEKIDNLKEILDDPNIRIEGINYIDLRFEDVVIAPK